jgi:hypothetical protein
VRRHFQGGPSESGRYGRDREKLVPMSLAINGSRYTNQRCVLHTYPSVAYMHLINYRNHFYRVNATFHFYMFCSIASESCANHSTRAEYARAVLVSRRPNPLQPLGSPGRLPRSMTANAPSMSSLCGTRICKKVSLVAHPVGARKWDYSIVALVL